MTQPVSKLIKAAFLLLVLPVAAQEPVGDMAKLVTDSTLPSECLAPVVINRIDGVRQVAPGKGHLLDPGIHTINGLVTLDTTQCNHPEGDLEISNSPDIEVNFEAGKAYYIAYDRKSPNSGDWKLVIWKVEQFNRLEYQSEQ